MPNSIGKKTLANLADLLEAKIPKISTRGNLHEGGKHRHQFFVLLIGSVASGALSAHFWPDASASAAARHIRVIKAEKFELMAPDGSQRGMIQVTPRGTAVVALCDANGKSRAEFKVMADGSSAVAFYDDLGRRRVVVGESEGDRSGIALYGTRGTQLGGLNVTRDGESSLTLDDQSRKVRAGLGVPASGQPALKLPRVCISSLFLRNKEKTHDTTDG